MLGQVHFLNLEYLILKVYNIFLSVDVAELPERALSWVELVQALGLGISLLLLAAIVYAKINLKKILHELERKREEEIHARARRRESKNPRWEHVVGLVSSASESDWRQAIIEADVLLGEMLESLGIPGESIGEKLKNVSRDHFTTLDLAWEAHKVRNEIAHQGQNFALTEREAAATVDLFRRVFDEFGFI